MYQIQQGDCLELMGNIPDKSIDMILADLPYGTTACPWDTIIPFEPLWENYKRIIKPNGCIALFGSEPFSSYLRLSNIKQYKYDWVWYKNNPTGITLAGKQPMRAYETISIFNAKNFYPIKMKSRITDRKINVSNGKFSSKKSEHYNIQPTKEINFLNEFINPWNVLEFKVVNRANGTFHPSQKPLDLLEYLILTYTLENETVLDNTMGSGSTGVACIRTNRNFIGFELDKNYFSIAERRILEEIDKTSLFNSLGG